MKQHIQLNELTPDELRFVLKWRKNKGYTVNADLSFGECVELTMALSYNYHLDWSDGRFFNNILTHDEAVLAWEDYEPIDSFFYEFRKQYKRRLAQGTLTEPVTEEVSTNA